MSFNSKFNRRRSVLTWQLCTFIALMLVKTTSLTHLMHACRCSDCVPVHLGTPPPHSHCSSGPPSSPTRTSTNDGILTGRQCHLARTRVSRRRCCCCYPTALSRWRRLWWSMLWQTLALFSKGLLCKWVIVGDVGFLFDYFNTVAQKYQF